MIRTLPWAALAVLLLLAGCKEGQQSSSSGASSSSSGTSGSTSTSSSNQMSAGASSEATAQTEATQPGKETTLPSGLKMQDLVVGTGAVAGDGMSVSVHYTGWLTDGTMFDSSLSRGEPFPFPVGGGRVIRGWDEGVAGMKVGGKRTLIIPPDLGYGGTPRSGIPAFSTLIFEVELLAVK
jgi:FKBP-type peptidyl-prolyl cis-trans isomerase